MIVEKLMIYGESRAGEGFACAVRSQKTEVFANFDRAQKEIAQEHRIVAI